MPSSPSVSTMLMKTVPDIYAIRAFYTAIVKHCRKDDAPASQLCDLEYLAGVSYAKEAWLLVVEQHFANHELTWQK